MIRIFLIRILFNGELNRKKTWYKFFNKKNISSILCNVIYFTLSVTSILQKEKFISEYLQLVIPIDEHNLFIWLFFLFIIKEIYDKISIWEIKK